MVPMPSTEFSPEQKQQLWETATASIESGLQGKNWVPDLAEYPAELNSYGACFVTLMKNASLRGCIGSLEAHQPLIRDVAANAYNAAFRDPRFPRLTVDEWPACEFSISILTKPEPLVVTSEGDLLAKLRPGLDGVIFTWRHHRATYLPSVWEQLPDPAMFLGELKRKAGLAADFWADDVAISTYQTIAV